MFFDLIRNRSLSVKELPVTAAQTELHMGMWQYNTQ